MEKQRYSLIWKLPVLLLVMMILTCPAAPGWGMEDTIIAVVNDEVITLRDLKDYINAALVQLKTGGESPEQLQAIIGELEDHGLERLIEDRLIITEAIKRGVEVRDEAVDEKVAEVKSHYGSEQDFLNALLRDGVTLTDLRNKIADQLKVKFLIDMEVRSKIFVNPQEVTDYYRNNAAKYQRPERLDLDSIFIPFTGETPSEAWDKAYQAQAQLKEGKDFGEVAREFSGTPSVGIIRKGQMLPAIEKNVFALKTGEISSITEVQNGLYIFQVKERLPEEVAPLEEVKDDITSLIFQKKFRELFQGWVAKLKRDAFIEIKD